MHDQSEHVIIEIRDTGVSPRLSLTSHPDCRATIWGVLVDVRHEAFHDHITQPLFLMLRLNSDVYYLEETAAIADDPTNGNRDFVRIDCERTERVR